MDVIDVIASFHMCFQTVQPYISHLGIDLMANARRGHIFIRSMLTDLEPFLTIGAAIQLIFIDPLAAPVWIDHDAVDIIKPIQIDGDLRIGASDILSVFHALPVIAGIDHAVVDLIRVRIVAVCFGVHAVCDIHPLDQRAKRFIERVICLPDLLGVRVCLSSGLFCLYQRFLQRIHAGSRVCRKIRLFDLLDPLFQISRAGIALAFFAQRKLRADRNVILSIGHRDLLIGSLRGIKALNGICTDRSAKICIIMCCNAQL